MMETRCAWFFLDYDGDIQVTWFTHMTLTLALNHGLETYMDTRIAVHPNFLFERMKQASLGRSILMDAAARNPYNLRVFRELREAPPEEAMATYDLIQDSLNARYADYEDDLPVEILPTRRPGEDLSDADEEDYKVQLEVPEKWRIKTYRNRIAPLIAGRVSQVSITAENPEKHFAWFDKYVKGGDVVFAPKRQECLRVMQGADVFREKFEAEIATHAKATRQAPPETRVAMWAQNIALVTADLGTAQKRIDWLTAQRAKFPKDKDERLYKKTTMHKIKGRRHKRIPRYSMHVDPLFNNLHTQLLAELRAAGDHDAYYEYVTDMQGVASVRTSLQTLITPHAAAPSKKAQLLTQEEYRALTSLIRAACKGFPTDAEATAWLKAEYSRFDLSTAIYKFKRYAPRLKNQKRKRVVYDLKINQAFAAMHTALVSRLKKEGKTDEAQKITTALEERKKASVSP